MNEAETRAELIDPKLKACGWVKSILDKAFSGTLETSRDAVVRVARVPRN